MGTKVCGFEYALIIVKEEVTYEHSTSTSTRAR